jgi:hypothetical protein
MKTPHSRSKEKVAPTHKTRDRENMATLRKTCPSCNTRRAMRIRRRTRENGVSTIKSTWHNTEECRSNQSLVVELKYFESEADCNSKSNPEGGKRIMDVEPNTNVTTTKVHPSKTEELEEGEHLFHSHMWVKGASLHFIINSCIQKNLISTQVEKWLDLPTTPHP